MWLWADSEYIRRVMVNLLDNAIQSLEESQADDPKIEISLESKDEDAKDLFVVRVSDNGPGIAPEMRARIFDPYVSAKAKGTGLGLAIVQRIVMEHRGRIYCEESSQGACFVIELPMLKKDMYGPKNTHS